MSCAVCTKKSSQTCSKCSSIYYCSRDHQILDWKRHKNNCAPFKILQNATLGRYVVATRDISAGEVIMRKDPLILGPKMASNILCLGCHKKLDLSRDNYKCFKCSWPLCSEKCADSQWHRGECAMFTQSKFKPNFNGDNITQKQSVYSAIVPLRALLLKRDNSNNFQVLLDCGHHLEQHRQTQIYDILEKNLTPLFLDKLKIDTTPEEIMKICSIFDTNSFEIRENTNNINIRGLFPLICLLSHDCRHNTRHCFVQSSNNSFKLVLSATVDIKKGAKITTTYTQTLWPTIQRRWHLKMAKLFDCACDRCADPTEFNTYIGAINCSKCNNGKIISLEPLNRDSDWSCDTCGYVVAAKSIIWGNEALKEEISKIDKTSPVGFERFLEKYKQALHPKNTFSLQIKHALIQIYGNLPGFELENLTVPLLDRKIELCNELLEVADVLEPGFSRFRGSLLYDLQAAMVMKAKMEFADDKITKNEAERILEESVGILQEAAKILESEPDLNEMLKKRLENLKGALES